jgi:menaquinone reductase, iron-sulfur cluster-binding subunit
MKKATPTRISRREALFLAATTVGGAAARGALAATPSPPAAQVRRLGMAIDLDRCLRCRACVVACASENNIAPLGPERAVGNRPIHWMDMLIMSDSPRATSPLGPSDVPIPCMHCERPECVKVCPVGATYVGDDGIVAQIWDRCIGCRYCMVACPYSRRYYNWSAPVWPGGDASAANPDVAIRPAGVVEKCTFCQHRVRAAVERARVNEAPLVDDMLVHLPACAATCPTRAITFGDLADTSSMVSTLVRSPRAVQVLAHLGTGPKVFYLRGKR